jgi:glucose-1-phosphatase
MREGGRALWRTGRTVILAPMQVKFFYFDLGRVLVNFSVEQMLRQIGDVAGLAPERIREIVFTGGLWKRLESGGLSEDEFYELFCTAAGSRIDRTVLARAAAEIFELNVSIVPLVAQLAQAGYAMGILSNTCQVHWDYCRDRYRIVADGFRVHALSYRIGAMKPDAAIFHAAADLAGVRPDEILFVDDLPEHVAGARSIGIDAVQYTTTPALAAELRKRCVRLNY